jgi:hypothetical protein
MARFALSASLRLALGAVAALFAGIALPACDCRGSELQCDDSGACWVCDAYGCRPATPSPGGSGGQGGAAGQGGGAGQGGAAGQAGAGGEGGSGPCDPTTTVCPCADDGSCTDGLACVGGLCIDPCTYSYECGPGKLCANGECVDGCSDSLPCDAGFTCDKGVCVPDQANPQCGVDANCPNQPATCEQGICLAACESSTDCPMGQVCDGAAGGCIDDPSPKPACQLSSECVGIQVCLDDGYCHYPCDSLQACKLIDNRFVACEAGVCRLAEEIDPECTLEKPCPSGQDCISNECL